MEVKVACDLRYLFGPARDQGTRPTCLAFAASDTHAAIRPAWTPLSCEYAYCHAIKLDGGHPKDGVTLNAILTTLRESGQPPESIWPYLQTIPNDLTLWKPPKKPEPLFRRDCDRKQPSIEEILKSLDAGVPVIITMCLSTAFFKPAAGGIIISDEPPDPAIRHGMVAVGYGALGGKPLILVRNSWGTAWGIGGYGWVAADYIAPRLLGVAILTRDLTNVPSH